MPCAAFCWLAGEAMECTSSASYMRYFCPHCGASPALFARLSASTLGFIMANLDRLERTPADRHI